MKGKGFSARFCRKCLHSTLPVSDMVRFARMVFPDYDINKQSGYAEGTPIATQDAANVIVSDMIKNDYFIDFVELLIKINHEGYMGRSYDMRGLDDVITDITRTGYTFDKASGQFFENQNERISRGWGRLSEGDEKHMTVLRLDIAGNSILVKENPHDLITRAYSDLRAIVTRAAVSRLGRLWSWEGDGALAAFMAGRSAHMAVFAGIEIINELFLYNRLSNPLNSEIKLRVALHSGPVRYSESEAQCLKNETIKRAIALEGKAAVPNSMVISNVLAVSLDQQVVGIFSEEQNSPEGKYRMYQVKQEAS
ncbi:MAG: hypothetical protein LBJ31_10610 [Treponema sp.]|jgi:class 3 adenylate cyclase|nr:hypothetical protein [Treponema sp.]